MADRLATPEPTPSERALEHWLDRRYDDEAIWTGLVPGPTVAEVAGRLSAVPRDFLAESVELLALAGDVFDGPADGALAGVFRDARPLPASRQGVALGLWLYASEDLLGGLSRPLLRTAVTRVLAALGFRLAAVVDPYRWLVEADRREEAARAVILWSGQHPGDEDYPTARGRWSALDSLARDQALASTMADYLHRQEVMRRLQEKRAREAASRYTPE